MTSKRKSRGAALLQQLGVRVDATEQRCKAVRLQSSLKAEAEADEELQRLNSLFSSLQAQSEGTDAGPPSPASLSPPAAAVVHGKRKYEAAAQATVIELDYTQSRILKTFQMLQLVLATLRSRKQLATFSRIQDGMERMTQQPFTMDHLTDVIAVCPDMFAVRWMKDAAGADFILCVAFDPQHHDATKTEQYADRLQRLGRSGTPSYSLPEKPELPKRSDSATVMNPLHNIRSEQGTSLDELRRNAARREQMMKELNLTRAMVETSQQEQRMHLLPILLDCIHSHFLIAKRTQQPVAKVIASIMQQQRLGNPSRSEAKTQLELLASLIPRFVTILAADRDHSQQVLRLNLSCSYSTIRKQLLEAVKGHCETTAMMPPPR